MAIDYNTLSDQELKDQFLQMDLRMVAHVSGNLTPDKAALVIRSLEEDASDEAAQRICAFFLGLQTKDQVTAVGKMMNTKYTLKLIEEVVKLDHSHLWKISALLIGLTHRVFLTILDTASPEEMEVIQHEALKEPLQHHLTVFVHEANQEVEEKSRQVMILREQAEKIPPENISYDDIQEWLNRIYQISRSWAPLMTKMKRALKIAWNTNRLDLIERLNQIMETLKRTERLMVGHPRSENTLPTGFYLVLEQNVCKVYGFEGDPEALLDTEPAVEALAKLSLWYIKDYWEAGLLPQIKEESELELDPRSHSDKECLAYRETLMKSVNQNLSSLNLTTVGSFKAAFIGTVDVLKETIKHRLQT